MLTCIVVIGEVNKYRCSWSLFFSMFLLIELMLLLVYVIDIGMDDRGVYARRKFADWVQVYM